MDAALPARLHAAARSRPATGAASTRWAAWPRRSRSRTTRSANDAALAKVRADKRARGHRRPRRHLGRAPGPRAGRARGLRRRACRARTSSTGRARTSRVTARGPAAGARRARDHRGRPAPERRASASSTSRPGCAASGCVPLYNLMEDAATAEISRDAGLAVDPPRRDARRRPRASTAALFARIARRGARRASAREVGDDASPRGRFERAAALFDALATVARARRVPDDLPAYDRHLIEHPTTRSRSPCMRLVTPRHSTRAGTSDSRWAGIERPYSAADVDAAARLRARSSTRSPSSAPSGSGSCSTTEAYVARARRADRQPGDAAGAGRPQGDLPVRLAGRGRRQPRRARCTPTRASTPPTASRTSSGASTRRSSAPTRSTHAEGKNGTDWFAPIVADAEAGFGGPLNAFELMKGMIEAGAAGVHFEDQLASEKKCGHMGGKVLVPTSAVHPHAVAARLAADVWTCRRSSSRAPTPTARKLLTSDVDERDRPFLTGERTAEGFFRHPGRPRRRDRARPRLRAVRRPDLVRDLRRPDLAEAKRFAEAIHAQLPGQAARLQLLAVVQLEEEPRRRRRSRRFQRELGAMGYKFQFVTLAGLPRAQPRHVRARARATATRA